MSTIDTGVTDVYACDGGAEVAGDAQGGLAIVALQVRHGFIGYISENIQLLRCEHIVPAAQLFSHGREVGMLLVLLCGDVPAAAIDFVVLVCHGSFPSRNELKRCFSCEHVTAVRSVEETRCLVSSLS